MQVVLFVCVNGLMFVDPLFINYCSLKSEWKFYRIFLG